jgi:hypothetical protein
MQTSRESSLDDTPRTSPPENAIGDSDARVSRGAIAGAASPAASVPATRTGRDQPERADLLRFAWLLFQLILVVCLVQRYQIESKAFFELTALAAGGFAVHYFLPMRMRLPFFLLLSLAGIGLVLGVIQAAWLVGIGLGLIGITQLPVSISGRVALLVLAGAVLAALRAGYASVPWSAAVWPVLGSIFMFRLIVYMYDLAHGQAQSSLWQRLSYFFLLPNVCFPLFPVVDFRTFVRTYYDGPRHANYQVGVDWIIRGAVQLLFYRFVYQSLSIDPYDVANAGHLAHYFLWLYLLYIRVSGQFHIIVGLLRLFGFNLPETHRLYYLASSFTDFWRRINIYWKDFMMKVFYYPMFFRLKRLGPEPALVLSTVYVFALTWALHAYQWFWIRGSYLLTWNDVLFWVILCGLVVVNALWEARHGRQRSIAGQAWTWGERAKLAAKTAGTFAVICVLWSFWSSESVSFWLSLWHAALVPPTTTQWQMLLGLVTAGALVAAAALAWNSWTAAAPQARLVAQAAMGAGVVLALNAVSISAVNSRLGQAGTLIVNLRYGGLNRAEMTQLERGYYEDLLTVDRFNTELGALYAKRPPGWTRSLADLGLTRSVAGGRVELAPHAAAPFKGVMLRTNQWGMHDQEYALQRPPDTFRIALLGASHTMGSGVDRDATFEAVLERRLNGRSDQTDQRHFEILNFAVYGYYATEQPGVLESKVLQFAPDAVFYVGHPEDAKRMVHDLATRLHKGQPLPYEFLSDVARRANVNANTPPRLLHRRLEPFGDELLTQVYERLVATCRARGIVPVWIRLPMVLESPVDPDLARDIERAEQAGFVVLDLSGVYDGHKQEELWVAEWDAHPNAKAHQLVADRLEVLLRQKWDLILSGGQ